MPCGGHVDHHLQVAGSLGVACAEGGWLIWACHRISTIVHGHVPQMCPAYMQVRRRPPSLTWPSYNTAITLL